jgi:hypothetical protein
LKLETRFLSQDPSATRRNVFESAAKTAFGIIVPSLATNFPSDNAMAFVPFAGPQEAVMSALDQEPRLITNLDDASMQMSTPSWKDSPTSLYLSQVNRRQVLINTRNTIQQTFFGYITRGEFTNLLNSYNVFNLPTRSAANSLATQYNEQARRDTLFAAMTAMANAAVAEDATLCRFKATATVNAINDFLANVGV